MQADNYFEIGTSHEVCQDYALTGIINPNIGFAIISDGCTMSHKECGQVDLGARVLSHSAKDVLKRLWTNKTSVKVTDDVERHAMNKFLRERSIITARMIEKQLDLPRLFVDCTLLTAFADDAGNAQVFVYGDGSIFVQFKDGKRIVVDVTFLSSAPYYLSYHTDPERQAGYVEEFGATPVLIDTYTLEGAEIVDKKGEQVLAKDPDLYKKTTFQWENVEFISITSDGAKSFMKHVGDNYNPVNYLSVINEFNSFKNLKGVFVQRRMKAVGKQNKKDEVTHYDDISMASISTEKE